MPKPPNFDKEAKLTLQHDGLPPLEPEDSVKSLVFFGNVSSIITRKGSQLEELALVANEGVVVDGGRIACKGPPNACQHLLQSSAVRFVDLAGGCLAPGLVSFGSPLGLEEITGEASTSDGFVLDPLKDEMPDILKGTNSIVYAVDGLQYSTRNAW